MTVRCVAKIGIVRCGRYYVKGICGRDAGIWGIWYPEWGRWIGSADPEQLSLQLRVCFAY